VRKLGVGSLQRLLGASSFAQVDDERYGVRAGLLERRATDQRRHPGAILPTEFFLVAVTPSDRPYLRHASLRGGVPLGRRKRGPLKSSRHEIVPAIADQDRKSTRLNSSHDQISYAVFCLKKKKK